MADGVYVRVPRDLADCLVEDGFRSAGTERGIEAVLADSANLVTVLIGSHEISRFAGHPWAAVRRRRISASPGVKVIKKADARAGELFQDYQQMETEIART